ncbi:MAG: hypothetical protein Q9P01_14765 [Anaerolineae bacterium]|nr:hypothetical protein [Anaerolineae bacterium]MDQ7036043.1 hypothetical protein [Anaerolineae bacterium]
MVKIKFLPLIFMLLLAACQQEDIVIPTLRVLPTATNTATLTATPTATQTLTPTVTPSPTLTLTPTATQTNTPLPTSSPTNTLTPFPTRTNTATPSLTPLPTRTLETLAIALYQSNIRVGNYGDPVRFRWETNGDSARIERLDTNGNLVETIAVNPIGSYQTNLPTSGAVAIYRLVTMREGQEVRSSISFDFRAACTITWYFSTADDIGCPSSGASSGQLSYQQFEQGFMIRLRSAGTDRVCGIQNSTQIYTCFVFAAFTGTAPATPVPNRFEPGDSFADAYYNQLAIGGFWYEQIGWGTSQEISTIASVQSSDRGFIYIDTPQGIIGFDQNLNGGQTIIRVIEQE